MSYWDKHPDSTQSRSLKQKVILRAAELFNLTDIETEALAYKAGLSLCVHKGGLSDMLLVYDGSYKRLYDNALVSERMFRYYKASKEPTKQALLSLAIILGLPIGRIEFLLRQYGYCLSKSIVSDVIVSWFLNTDLSNSNRGNLLKKINETLDEMELPLLMTRQNKDGTAKQPNKKTFR